MPNSPMPIVIIAKAKKVGVPNFKRTIVRSCYHCGAFSVLVRVDGKSVWYCEKHGFEFGEHLSVTIGCASELVCDDWYSRLGLEPKERRVTMSEDRDGFFESCNNCIKSGVCKFKPDPYNGTFRDELYDL